MTINMTQTDADIIIEHMIVLEQTDSTNKVLQVLGDLIEQFEQPIATEINSWKHDNI